MTRDILIIATVLIVSALVGLGVPLVVPVRASGGDVPDCAPIGKSGPLVVSRCEDEKSGAVIYVNNYGMMVVEP